MEMKFESKRELVDSIEHEHETFVQLAGCIPRGRYGEGGVWGECWTIKDLFAHLTAWEQMFLGWYRQGTAGRAPMMPAEGYKWSQLPSLNRVIREKNKDRSWRSVRTEFDRSYQEILALTRELSEGELLSPGLFGWTGRHPLTTYLAPNTCSHYRTATKILKRWLRKQDPAAEG